MPKYYRIRCIAGEWYILTYDQMDNADFNAALEQCGPYTYVNAILYADLMPLRDADKG